jgi:hypothetical protein
MAFDGARSARLKEVPTPSLARLAHFQPKKNTLSRPVFEAYPLAGDPTVPRSGHFSHQGRLRFRPNRRCTRRRRPKYHYSSDIRRLWLEGQVWRERNPLALERIHTPCLFLLQRIRYRDRVGEGRLCLLEPFAGGFGNPSAGAHDERRRVESHLDSLRPRFDLLVHHYDKRKAWSL